MQKIQVKQKWSMSMKTGTHNNYTSILDTEPNEEMVVAFVESVQKNVGKINRKIEISTWWEVYNH